MSPRGTRTWMLSARTRRVARSGLLPTAVSPGTSAPIPYYRCSTRHSLQGVLGVLGVLHDDPGPVSAYAANVANAQPTCAAPLRAAASSSRPAPRRRAKGPCISLAYPRHILTQGCVAVNEQADVDVCVDADALDARAQTGTGSGPWSGRTGRVPSLCIAGLTASPQGAARGRARGWFGATSASKQ